jgi:hypothetical protein
LEVEDKNSAGNAIKKTKPFKAAVESWPSNLNRPASQPARMIAKTGMDISISI